MNWTKKQKTYGGVLALALAAFVVDRCFFSPAAAGAHPAAAPTASIAPGSAAVAAKPVAARDTPAADELPDLSDFAARLEKAGATVPALDPFTPSAAWLARMPHRAAPTQADAFIARHRLTGVLVGPEAGLAIVDGKPFAPGQSLDGFRCVSIGQTFAEFRSADGRAVLKLNPVSLSAQ